MEGKLKNVTVVILSCKEYIKIIDNLKLSRRMNSLKLSRARSLAGWLTGEWFNLSRTISVLEKLVRLTSSNMTLTTLLWESVVRQGTFLRVNLPYFSVMPDPFKLFLLLSFFLAPAWTLAPLHFWGEIINLKCLKMEHCKSTVDLGYKFLKVPYVVITDEYTVGLVARN